MYYDILLRIGVVATIAATVMTGRWVLLGWESVMLLLFTVQRVLPARLSDETARSVFGVTVIVQCALSVAVAIATSLVGATFIAAGMIANTLAIMFNGVRMPINDSGCVLNGIRGNACYTQVTGHTRLVWLCDILRTTDRVDEQWVISAGDALECIGIWVLAVEVLLAV